MKSAAEFSRREMRYTVYQIQVMQWAAFCRLIECDSCYTFGIWQEPVDNLIELLWERTGQITRKTNEHARPEGPQQRLKR